MRRIYWFLRFLTIDWRNDFAVFVAMADCDELGQKKWTFWKDHPLILTTENLPSHLDVNCNSRIYHIDSNLSVLETYKHQEHDLNYVVQRVGDARSLDSIAKSGYIWDRRTNLSNVHLNIVYILFPPIIMKQNNSETITGVYVDLFNALQEKLGFTYSLYQQVNNTFGSLDANGSFDGLFGEIQRGKANWSIAHTAVNAERSEFFDYSIPILKKPRKIVTRKPTENFDAFAYLLVFSLQFWMTLLISALVLIFVLYWILDNDSITNKCKFQYNQLAASFTFTMLSLFCREIYPLHSKLSGKIICLVVLFWGFLISASYNAILTSALATNRAEAPIDSLEDLLNSADYTLIFGTSGSVRDHFRKAPNGSTGKYN